MQFGSGPLTVKKLNDVKAEILIGYDGTHDQSWPLHFLQW